MSQLMGKKKAPPTPPPDEDAGTDTVRVDADLKRMVKWICEIEGIPSRSLMRQVAFDNLVSRFEQYRSQVEEEERLERDRAARLAALKQKGRPSPE